jgi:thiamine-phosphate pyrophosphorylase
LGLLRFAQLVRAARRPVFALGGVNAKTVRHLRHAKIAGVAAVEALLE